MQRRSSRLPEKLSNQPKVERLCKFMERLLAERGEEVEFVVLYGSRAREDWKQHSDFDILVGLREDDGKPFLRRLDEFWALKGPLVQPLVYSRPEWEKMASEFNFLFLEALSEGVVLFDRGGWEKLKRNFQRWLKEGRVRREGRRWRIFFQTPSPRGGEVG